MFKDEKKLRTIVNNYKIFIDTSSLLHDHADKIFSIFLLRMLIDENKFSNNSIVIIPKKVVEELQKHVTSSDKELSRKANIALNIINKYLNYEIASIHGDKNDSFADNLFLSVFTKFRIKYNLCLITQDIDLSNDILSLNQSSSVKHIKKILVHRIGNTNKLQEFHLAKHRPSRPNIIKKFKHCKEVIIDSDENYNISEIPSVDFYVISKKFGNIKLVTEIAKGGEGIAYLTDNNLVCKIYKRDKITKHRYVKLKKMVDNPINKKGICWPKDLVFNSNDEFVGFLMDKAEGHELQKSIFMPMLIKKKFPQWKKQNLVNLAISILILIKFLHERNVIIGDINPLNILVKSDNEVYIIDVDSFQVECFPCTVGTVNFTPPEIQGKDYKSFLRTFPHEDFAIATLIFMILLPGKPPYSQQGGGDPATNIKRKDFSYPLADASNGKTPPGKWRYIWSNLPYKIKEAFYNTFKNNERTHLDGWIKLLNSYSHTIKNYHISNELFPETFKIPDPIKVICSKLDCKKEYTESKKFIDKLQSQGKMPICIECRQSFSSCKEKQPKKRGNMHTTKPFTSPNKINKKISSNQPSSLSSIINDIFRFF